MLPINAVILQRNGSAQGQTTHPDAEQHQSNDDPRQTATVLKLLSQQLFDKLHKKEASQITNPINSKVRLSMKGMFRATPSLKLGKRPVQRRLGRLDLEWLCFDDRCNKLDALSCSSTLVSFFTRFQVSCADISPSCSHLMLDNSAGDIKEKHDDST